MDTFDIKMDLWKDFCDFLRFRLKEGGFVPASKDFDVVYQFFNINKKTIPAKPRAILYSDSFSCPENLRDGLSLIVEKLRTGKSISAHLSREARNADSFDRLLYDWGVHHLHLGTEMESHSGYVNRTKDLLFLRVDDNNAYLVGVFPHGFWAKQEIVKVIHRNWPGSIASHRLPGEVSLSNTISDADRAKLRKSGINTFTEVEKGSVYASIGGGYSSSGHSTEIVLLHNRIHNNLKSNEIKLKQNISDINTQLEVRTGKKHGLTYCFKLWFEDNEWYIMELVSFIIISKAHLIQ